MEKEFVNYNQALKLKELGFEEPCMLFFSKELNMSIWLGLDERSVTINKEKGDEDFLIPTFSQAFRWFRKEYNYNHSIVFTKHPFGTDEYQYMILLEDNEYVEINFKTYEEAESACLDKLIELVESK